MSAREFSLLIDRFYTLASRILVHHNALIDKIIGDQASGIFVPGFTGPQHARQAVRAAQAILRETGHGSKDEAWIPLGVGIHSGVAFVGSVGAAEGALDITVLGDVANTAARLSSQAGQGEILISEQACLAAGLSDANLEKRTLSLKGKEQQVLTTVLKSYDWPP